MVDMKKTLVFACAVALALALCGCAGSASSSASSASGQTASQQAGGSEGAAAEEGIEVPNVVGMEASEAHERLISLGLSPDGGATGKVTAQTPAAGEKSYPGQMVTLTTEY